MYQQGVESYQAYRTLQYRGITLNRTLREDGYLTIRGTLYFRYWPIGWWKPLSGYPVRAIVDGEQKAETKSGAGGQFVLIVKGEDIGAGKHTVYLESPKRIVPPVTKSVRSTTYIITVTPKSEEVPPEERVPPKPKPKPTPPTPPEEVPPEEKVPPGAPPGAPPKKMPTWAWIAIAGGGALALIALISKLRR